MKLKWLLTFSIVIASLSASANNDLPPGTKDADAKKTDIAGGVYNAESKKPLGNVSVVAYSNNKKEKTVTTDAQGNFSFEDLKPGTYKFVFEKEGFKKVTREKTIAKVDEACQLNISLEEHNSFDFMPGPSNFFDFD